MEYQYRMLCPYSMESIDFRLSQTHLSYNAPMSPTKHQGSLTYTASMETIQVPQSPVKNGSKNYLEVPEGSEKGSLQRCFSKSNEIFQLNPNPVIQPIKIEDTEQTKKDNQHYENLSELVYEGRKKLQKVHSVSDRESKEQKRKSILKVSNIEYQEDILQGSKLKKSIENNKNSRNSIRMGKIMTIIHNQIREKSKTIRHSKSKSNNKASPELKQKRDKKRSSSQDSGINNWQESSKVFQTLNDDVIKQTQPQLQSLESQSSNEDPLKCSILAITNSSSGINPSPEIKRRRSDLLDGKFKKQKWRYKNEVHQTDRPILNKEIVSNYKNLHYKVNSIRERIKSSVVTKKVNAFEPAMLQVQLYDLHLNNKIVMNKGCLSNRTRGKSVHMQNHQFSKDLINCISVASKRINATERILSSDKILGLKNKSISYSSQTTQLPRKVPSKDQYGIGKRIIQNNKLINLLNAELEIKNVNLHCENRKIFRKNKENNYKKMFNF